MKKTAIAIHTVLIVLEIIALIHDIYVFGFGGMFQYYTIDSNILQLLVSAAIIFCLRKDDDGTVPVWLHAVHLICAVCLTITFLIALLVLAPQKGFDYYFFSDVAPINHFLGPLLSVLTFLFLEKPDSGVPKKAVFAPLAATLFYGNVLLLLNWLRVVEGPYFFLQVHDEKASTVILWFAIISVLCIALAAVYLLLRRRRNSV